MRNNVTSLDFFEDLNMLSNSFRYGETWGLFFTPLSHASCTPLSPYMSFVGNILIVLIIAPHL